MALDVDKLLQPVSAEDPTGPDLSYDPAFAELDRISQGEPERQVGDEIMAAVEPAWRDVSKAAVELFGRTKHLRVSVLLLAAQIRQDNINGLRDGLKVIVGLVQQHWATLHPRLDPDDSNDPLERMNIFTSLAAPMGQVGDVLKIQEGLRRAVLASSNQAGKVTYRDIQIAKGELPPPGEEKPLGQGGVDAVFGDAPLEQLQQTAAALQEAVTLAKGLEAALDERVDPRRRVDLASFSRLVGEISQAVAGWVAVRSGGAAPGTAANATSGGGSGSGGAGGALAGEVNSPQDVLLAIQKICRYYERSERSSPVPLLLMCAERMVSKKYLEITKILTSDALRYIEEMSGAKKD